MIAVFRCLKDRSNPLGAAPATLASSCDVIFEGESRICIRLEVMDRTWPSALRQETVNQWENNVEQIYGIYYRHEQ